MIIFKHSAKKTNEQGPTWYNISEKHYIHISFPLPFLAIFSPNREPVQRLVSPGKKCRMVLIQLIYSWYSYYLVVLPLEWDNSTLFQYTKTHSKPNTFLPRQIKGSRSKNVNFSIISFVGKLNWDTNSDVKKKMRTITGFADFYKGIRPIACKFSAVVQDFS